MLLIDQSGGLVDAIACGVDTAGLLFGLDLAREHQGKCREQFFSGLLIHLSSSGGVSRIPHHGGGTRGGVNPLDPAARRAHGGGR